MLLLNELLTVLLLGIAAGTAAFTITKTKITMSARVWITERNDWFGALINCPHCLSHWLCGIAILIYRPRILDLNIVLDLGVAWLVSVFIAAVTFGITVRQIKALNT